VKFDLAAFKDLQWDRGPPQLSTLVFASMRALKAFMAQAGRAKVVVAGDPTMHGDGSLSDEESDVHVEGTGVGKV